MASTTEEQEFRREWAILHSFGNSLFLSSGTSHVQLQVSGSPGRVTAAATKEVRGGEPTQSVTGFTLKPPVADEASAKKLHEDLAYFCYLVRQDALKQAPQNQAEIREGITADQRSADALLKFSEAPVVRSVIEMAKGARQEIETRAYFDYKNRMQDNRGATLSPEEGARQDWSSAERGYLWTKRLVGYKTICAPSVK